MSFQNYQCIEFHREGCVLHIKLNRPQQKNAVNETLHLELSRVFVDAQRDAESDVIVLTGNGAAFCALNGQG